MLLKILVNFMHLNVDKVQVWLIEYSRHGYECKYISMHFYSSESRGANRT